METLTFKYVIKYYVWIYFIELKYLGRGLYYVSTLSSLTLKLYGEQEVYRDFV